MTLLLWLCLLGALLELDTTYAFQLTLSRGIVAGPLLGLATGDVLTGVQIGLFTELLFIDINPLGGMLPPSAAICCTITLAFCMLEIPVYFSFFFGVIGSILFSVCEIALRKRRSNWLTRQEQKIHYYPVYINRVIVRALGMSFISNFLFVFVFSLLFGPAFAQVVPLLPEQLQVAGKFAYMAVPWIGLATLVAAFRLKTR